VIVDRIHKVNWQLQKPRIYFKLEDINNINDCDSVVIPFLIVQCSLYYSCYGKGSSRSLGYSDSVDLLPSSRSQDYWKL